METINMKRILLSLSLAALLLPGSAFAQTRPETGGTGSLTNTGTDDTVMLGDGNSFEESAVPDCTDSGGNFLAYTASTNAFSCGDLQNNALVVTGDWDFGGGGIEVENGTTPPACTVGQLFVDTDATAGQQLMACESGTFVVQGDGTGGNTLWNNIGDPTGAGVIAMGVFEQRLRWTTSGTASAFDAFLFEAEHQATTDATTQQLVVIKRIDGTGTAVWETLLRLKNEDPQATVTSGIAFTTNGTITTGIDASATGITTVLDIGANDAFSTTSGGTITEAELNIIADGLIALASEVSGTLPVGNGGTGATTLTDGGILLGSGTGAITALGAAANGQIPIGDGTTDPVLATITGTAGEVDVTNGAGSITLSLSATASAGLVIIDEEADGSLLYNGTDKVFTLQSTPADCANVSISFNGYVLEQVGTNTANNHFTCSGTTITLNLAPNSGDHVAASYTL